MSSFGSGGHQARAAAGEPAVARVRVLHDHAVLEVDGARAPGGDVALVGDDHDGDAALGAQAREHLHHLVAGRGVEVAGRLVGQQQRRLVDQRAGDGHALLLPARELVGMVRPRGR